MYFNLCARVNGEWVIVKRERVRGDNIIDSKTTNRLMKYGLAHYPGGHVKVIKGNHSSTPDDE